MICKSPSWFLVIVRMVGAYQSMVSLQDFPLSTAWAKEVFQYFIATSWSSVKKFLYQRTLLSPFGCEVFLTGGLRGSRSFSKQKVPLLALLIQFPSSLFYTQLPLCSLQVSLPVFEFSCLFLFPVFMLSVLITWEHAQLIPLCRAWRQALQRQE